MNEQARQPQAIVVTGASAGVGRATVRRFARTGRVAAHHQRPELYVGLPTVTAIVGDKLAPRLLDHSLARTGYRSQQTDEPRDSSQPDNLWAPVDAERDYGVHGAFDARARARSPQLWATTHRTLLAAAGAGLAGVAAAGAALWRRAQ